MNSAAKVTSVHSFTMHVLRAAALALAIVAACWAQAAPNGTVTGTVTSGSGAPVVGIRVMVLSTVSSFAPTAISDEKGTFTFPGRPLGGVTVKVLDAKGNVLGSATGTLNVANQVLVLPVTIP